MSRDATEQASYDIRVIVENDEAVNADIREAVFEHLRDNIGYTEMTVEEYRQELGRDPMAYQLSSTVRDIIYDAFMDGVDQQSLQGFALTSFLDYGNVALWEDIAQAYVPSVEDYAEHFGEEV